MKANNKRNQRRIRALKRKKVEYVIPPRFRSGEELKKNEDRLVMEIQTLERRINK